MAVKGSTIALLVSFFGIASFIFGIIAENKKPAYGTPIPGKGVVICKFPSDPTVAFGSLSIVTLFISSVLGMVSIFYSYKGISVPTNELFKSTSLVVFFLVAIGVTVFGAVMMFWATITESLHRINNVHHDTDYLCPTAKTGLFGGAAFLGLDATLFWLICQMLTGNAREDFLDEDTKGDYGQVLVTDIPKGSV